MLKLWLGLVVLYEVCIMTIGTIVFVRKGNRVCKSRSTKVVRKGCISTGATGSVLTLMIFAAKEVFFSALHLRNALASFFGAATESMEFNFITFVMVMAILLTVAGIVSIATYLMFNLGSFLQLMWLRHDIRTYPTPRRVVIIVDAGEVETTAPRGNDCPPVTLNMDDLAPVLRRAQLMLANTQHHACVMSVNATVGDPQAPNVTDRGRRMLADFLQAQEKAVDASIPSIPIES